MKKNIPILIAGGIMAFTTILHLTAGHLDHVVPLLASELDPSDKAVWLGVWHMASLLLLVMSFLLIRQGVQPVAKNAASVRLIAWLNLLIAVVFILVSLVTWAFAPQWILFLPMAVLIFKGLKGKDTPPMSESVLS